MTKLLASGFHFPHLGLQGHTATPSLHGPRGQAQDLMGAR